MPKTLRQCCHEIAQLKIRVQQPEEISSAPRAPLHQPLGGSSAIDWRRYPALLDVHHLAEIYSRAVGGVRRALYERDPKLPTPCQVRPYKVRKDDCKRHWDRMQ